MADTPRIVSLEPGTIKNPDGTPRVYVLKAASGPYVSTFVIYPEERAAIAALLSDS